MMLQKLRHFVITFKTSILSVFISLFVIATFTLISITSYRFSVTLSYTAFNLMEKTSNAVIEKIVSQMQRASMLSELSADLIESNVVDQRKLSYIANYTFHLMNQESKKNSSIEGAYWADEQGNYVYSQRLKDNTIKSEITDRTHTPARDTSYYYDKNGKIIRTVESKKPSDLNYDAHLRPWYLEAKKFDTTTWTEVYRYYDSDLLGMSTLTPGFGKDGLAKGVFGVDIQIDFLKEFIENLKITKNGIVFIVNEKSKLVSFPHVISYQNSELLDIHHISYPWIIQSFDEYKKVGKEQFSFEWEGKDYLAVYKRIKRASTSDLIVGVVIPKNDFLGELYKINLITLGVTAFVFLFGLFLISHLTSKIVKPLKKLTDEIDKIKNFNLGGDSRIQSNIKEVISISESVQSMKVGLRSFQKYVPSALVRQLIELGEDVRVGGVKKPLVIFFSDIVDFTSLAEKEDPEKLTQHLCEYFAELSHIIVEEKGTIDKYIGDSIMAFWGAPASQEFAIVFAVQAALRCKRRLKELNKKWKQLRQAELPTRIGIHMGQAIVGNIGSPERINYTVIGDAVNHASRLENINRKYGTEIIVSSNIYEELKTRFVFRYIDKVSLKGRNEIEDLYELISENKSEISFDLEGYSKNFAQGFLFYTNKKWASAIVAFKECLSIYPQDTVSVVFINRCEEFQLNPPSENWNGVWIYSENVKTI